MALEMFIDYMFIPSNFIYKGGISLQYLVYLNTKSTQRY